MKHGFSRHLPVTKFLTLFFFAVVLPVMVIILPPPQRVEAA